MYSTDSVYERGWIKDKIAFESFQKFIPTAVPVY